MRLFPRLAKITIPRYEYAPVYGSRKVIKDPGKDQNHYYSSDIWTHYGSKIADLIPEGYIVYGELIGFTPDGAAIQKGYTYHLPQGEAELYVYRVAVINAQGTLSDLSWDGVKEFCQARGLKWTPELHRCRPVEADIVIDECLDTRFADRGDWNEAPLIVSHHKTVDEGFCIRQEGIVPTILKAKAPEFLRHETQLIDKGEADIESAA